MLGRAKKVTIEKDFGCSGDVRFYSDSDRIAANCAWLVKNR
jgi:hypothetical protein